MGKIDDRKFGVPDEESPEITEDQFRWAVSARDFPDMKLRHAFMDDRSAFLREAEASGIPREAFLGLDPNKPGFILRATRALEAAARAGRTHAAE